MAKPFADLFKNQVPRSVEPEWKGAQPLPLDERPLRFGKWKGRTPDQVADSDPSYIVWLYENVNPRPCSRSLYLACEMDVREAEAEQDIEHRFEYSERPF